MEIINHILHAKNGKYKPSEYHGSRDIAPRFVIMHCTATASSMDDNVKSMLKPIKDPKLQISAHLLIGRDGEIVQFVPFNLSAWHAGGGKWDFVKGNVNMNSWSLGIELLNAAFLEENEAGDYVKNDVVIPEDDRSYDQKSRKCWQKYPSAQIKTAIAVTKLLFKQYKTLEDVLGHDEIDPANRNYPRPAFPMQRFHAEVLGLDKKFPITRAYNTTRTANLSHNPGTEAEIIAASHLERNTPLGILKAQAGWAYVHVLQEIGGNPDLVGWIQRDRIEEDKTKPRHYPKPQHITAPGKQAQTILWRLTDLYPNPHNGNGEKCADLEILNSLRVAGEHFSIAVLIEGEHVKRH